MIRTLAASAALAAGAWLIGADVGPPRAFGATGNGATLTVSNVRTSSFPFVFATARVAAVPRARGSVLLALVRDPVRGRPRVVSSRRATFAPRSRGVSVTLTAPCIRERVRSNWYAVALARVTLRGRTVTLRETSRFATPLRCRGRA